MNLIKYLLALSIAIFLNGCAQKVYIKALTPATVGEMSNNKRVAITKFKNDKTALSSKVEAEIASYRLEGKKYFKVLNRKDIDKLIKEQRLQSSELIDEKTTVRIGKLIGAQAVINGEITTAKGKDGKYIEKRKRCKKYSKEKKECIKYEYYYVTCYTTDAMLSANMNIINVENSSVIHSENFSKSYQADSCKNYSKILNSKQALNMLSTNVANTFVSKLAPSYIYFRVSLLDEIELDSDDEQEDSLENALKYIEANRMDKAQDILTNLLDEFKGQSYVIAYNLGVVKEARGRYKEAKNLYALADNITNKPIDEINAAIIRIDRLIQDTNEAKRQIDAK